MAWRQSERLALVSRFKNAPEKGGAHVFLMTTGTFPPPSVLQGHLGPYCRHMPRVLGGS